MESPGSTSIFLFACYFFPLHGNRKTTCLAHLAAKHPTMRGGGWAEKEVGGLCRVLARGLGEGLVPNIVEEPFGIC